MTATYQECVDTEKHAYTWTTREKGNIKEDGSNYNITIVTNERNDRMGK